MQRALRLETPEAKILQFLTGIRCSLTSPSLRCFPCLSLLFFLSYSLFSRSLSLLNLLSFCLSSLDFFLPSML